jgi:hypothetical protein
MGWVWCSFLHPIYRYIPQIGKLEIDYGMREHRGLHLGELLGFAEEALTGMVFRSPTGIP